MVLLTNIFFICSIIGVAHISDLRIYIEQKRSIVLLIKTPKIPIFLENVFSQSNYSIHPNEIIISNKYYMMFTLNFDACDEGEIYIASIKA